MVTCLFYGALYASFGATFRKPDPIQRKNCHLHDSDDESQNGNQSGIAATEQNDVPLQCRNIVEHTDRDDVRAGLGQPAIGRGPGCVAFQCDVDFTCCPNELLQPMVVSALSASGGGHAPILAAKVDQSERSRVQTIPKCRELGQNMPKCRDKQQSGVHHFAPTGIAPGFFVRML